MVETLETAHEWSRLLELHGAVRDAISGALGTRGTPGLVMCHVSHLYPSGASLYFTFLARPGARRRARAVARRQDRRLRRDRGGGGDDHPPPRGRPRPRAVDAGARSASSASRPCESVKQRLDPAGIMNPGQGAAPAKARDERAPGAAPARADAGRHARRRDPRGRRRGRPRPHAGRRPDRQPYGIVHGGAMMAIAESLTSLGTARGVYEDGKIAMGQEMNASFMRPISDGSRERARARAPPWPHGLELGGRDHRRRRPAVRPDAGDDRGPPDAPRRALVALYVGTSGWAYPEWRGSFYPAGLPQSRFLEHYGRCFTACEVNATFYRVQPPAALARWADSVPEPFRFAVKAHRRLTYRKRLAPDAATAAFANRVPRLARATRPKARLPADPGARVRRARRRRARRGCSTCCRPASRSRASFSTSRGAHEVGHAIAERGGTTCMREERGEAPQALPPGPFAYVRLKGAHYADEERQAAPSTCSRARPRAATSTPSRGTRTWRPTTRTRASAWRVAASVEPLKLVRDRQAAVAAERLRADLDAGRGLAALVLGQVDQRGSPCRTTSAGRPRRISCSRPWSSST